MPWGTNEQPSSADRKIVELDNVSYTIGSVEYIAKRDEMISSHNAAKELLEQAKNSEMEIRTALAKFLFPDPKPGTQRVELNNGWNMKLVHKVNTKITASNETVDNAEDQAAEIGNEGTFLFERIITWTPKFSESEYKKLDTSLPAHKAVKTLIDELIEKTPAAPSIELEAPKAKLNA